MPQHSYVHEDVQEQVRNRWVYPPGCLPDVEDVVQRVASFQHYAINEREQRPKPYPEFFYPTSRAKVYRRNGVSPLCWNQETYPCPHTAPNGAGGLHGNVTLYSYHTGGSTLFSNPLYDVDTYIHRNMWAGPLREKLAEAKYNLGSSLAEYRETVKLFTGTAKSLHRAFQVLRGKIPRRKLRVCSIPAAVLQYNFGIAPMVEDLYSSVEILRHKLGRPLVRRDSVGIKVVNNGPFTYGSYDYDAKSSFKQRATVYYQVNPNYTLSNEFDFGNPVEWIWELIPFSFVVDWALPIGNWLGTLDALLGVENIHGTVTTRTFDQWTYRSNIKTQYIGRIGEFSNATYQRDVITTVPMPEFPAWSPSLSFKRAQNAVSLLLGMTRKCKGQ